MRNSLQGERVIFVFNTLDLGGAERQGILLAKHLQEAEKSVVEVWGFDGPGRTGELCEEEGIPWRVVPFRWTGSRPRLLRELLKFALELRRARPSVLLPYTMRPNLVCCAVWKWAGARLCIWQQRDAGMDRGPRRLERWAVKCAPAFVTNSPSGLEFLDTTLGVESAKVQSIRNGVTLAPPVEDRATWRRRLGLGLEAPIACMVANLHHHKDHETLLKAWRLLISTWPSAIEQPTLLLAGRDDGGMQSSKALAFDLELGRNVKYMGPVEDVAGLLRAVDLGVFSSRLEGSPNGVLECMASGLAVAATDIPGIRDAVGQEGLAYLAPPGNAERLADRIAWLLRDPVLRETLGLANRSRIEQDFGPLRMCEETVAVIKRGLR